MELTLTNSLMRNDLNTIRQQKQNLTQEVLQRERLSSYDKLISIYKQITELVDKYVIKIHSMLKMQV